ncbi:MAG: hypothetical protein ACRCXC_01720 [Legionella sp.]
MIANNTLRSLQIGKNNLGNDAIQYLDKNLSLIVLDLEGNHIDKNGVIAIARKPNLIYLNIDDNH